MRIDADILAHAAIFLLFVASGLTVSLVTALMGAAPWWAALAPTVVAIPLGHGVATRVGRPDI